MVCVLFFRFFKSLFCLILWDAVFFPWMDNIKPNFHTYLTYFLFHSWLRYCFRKKSLRRQCYPWFEISQLLFQYWSNDKILFDLIRFDLIRTSRILCNIRNNRGQIPINYLTLLIQERFVSTQVTDGLRRWSPSTASRIKSAMTTLLFWPSKTVLNAFLTSSGTLKLTVDMENLCC